MDIVVDIQGFRDTDKKFIAKEVAVVAIDAPIVNHWIMMPPHSFAELPETIRRENNWLTRNHHGIEWYDGEANPKYFISQLQEITRCVRYIYVRGSEKARYLQNLLSRNIYNLEGISPPFKNLTAKEEEKAHVQYCGHHGFRKFEIFHCALRNAYKLKSWLVAQNNHDNSDSITQTTYSSPENWIVSDDDNDDKENENIKVVSNNEVEKKNLQNINRNEKEEFTELISPAIVDRNEIVATINRSTQTDVENPITVQVANNSAKKVIQIIPLIRAPSLPTNELSRNSASITSTRCQTCGSLSCRQTIDGVDEVDGYHREYTQS